VIYNYYRKHRERFGAKISLNPTLQALSGAG